MREFDIFETTKKRDNNVVITPQGNILKYSDRITYTTDELKQLAATIRAEEFEGVFIKIDGNDITVIVTEESKYECSDEDDEIAGVDNSEWSKYLDRREFNSITVIGTAIDGFKAQVRTHRLDLSKLNTSRMTDMNAMFMYGVIDELEFGKVDTSNVVDMGRMFRQSRIEKMDLSGLDTSNVEYMNAMFEMCRTPKIDISKLDTSSCITMESMFLMCETKEIKVGNIDTSKVTSMCEMFGGTMLENLDLSKFNTNSVKYMNNMFETAEIKNINISGFDISSVQDMRCMFMYAKMDRLKLNWTIKEPLETIQMMFKNSEIGALDLSNFKVEQSCLVNDMFNGCTSVIKIGDYALYTYIKKMCSGVKAIHESNDGWLVVMENRQ